MIGRIEGTLLDKKKPPQLLVDVSGIGYEIAAPMSTFYQLPEEGAKIVLCTHLIVRDDAHLLFGFATETERQLFRNLIKTNGVGAKLALTLLSGISIQDFIRCIKERDVASLTRLPGVGKKTAERLIVEMRDRLVSIQLVSDSDTPSTDQTFTRVPTEVTDAIGALIALGYKAKDADQMINSVASPGLASDVLIRAALQTTML